MHKEEEGFTPVAVITRDHRYSGMLANRDFRIADILNDHNSDLLEMYDVLAIGTGTPAREVRFDQVVLKKDAVLLVVPQGTHEAPARRRNRYVERDRYGAMIGLPGYILSGVLHLPSMPIPSLLLAENSMLQNFLGMTNTTTHSSLHGLLPTQCDVVIVQRRAIESVQLTAQPLSRSEEAAG